jgi:hypothetical protein
MIRAQLTDLNRVYLTVSLAALPLLALWCFRRRRRNHRIAMAKVPSKTVVIVGASWAGINVAHGLLKQVPNVNVVLVSPSGKLPGMHMSHPLIQC